MKTVWKFKLIDTDNGARYPRHEVVSIKMPTGARALSVGVQDGEPQIWVLVDPAAPSVETKFLLLGTGENCATLGDLKDLVDEQYSSFVGTYMNERGSLVNHVFALDPHLSL